jgi:hypothetical protein
MTSRPADHEPSGRDVPDSVPAEQYINGALAMAKLAMLSAFDEAIDAIKRAAMEAEVRIKNQRAWHEKALTYGTRENRRLIEALHAQHEERRAADA